MNLLTDVSEKGSNQTLLDREVYHHCPVYNYYDEPYGTLYSKRVRNLTLKEKIRGEGVREGVTSVK